MNLSLFGNVDAGTAVRVSHLLSSCEFKTTASARRAIKRVTLGTRLTVEQGREIRAAVARHYARQQRVYPERQNNKPVESAAALRWNDLLPFGQYDHGMTRWKNLLPFSEYEYGMQAGRYFTLQTRRRHKFAHVLGEAYHRRIERLYVSRDAHVVPGRSKQFGVYSPDSDWLSPYYCRWQNAGAWWEGTHGNYCVVLETSRGRIAARIPVPANALQTLILDHPGLIHGDLWGIMRDGILVRYAFEHGEVVEFGVAMRFNRVIDAPWLGYYDPAASRTTQVEWEQGATIADCKSINDDKMNQRERAWDKYEIKYASRNITSWLPSPQEDLWNNLMLKEFSSWGAEEGRSF